jgi:hypothetical protein
MEILVHAEDEAQAGAESAIQDAHHQMPSTPTQQTIDQGAKSAL